jgi:HSP20 family protein
MTRFYYRPTSAVNLHSQYEPFRAVVQELLSGVESSPGGSATEVRMNVTDAANEYTIVADLPGVTKEDINIEINGADVKIAAATKPDDADKRSYARSLTLPAEVDEEKAAARFENGVLKLTLPKKAANAGKRLQVA